MTSQSPHFDADALPKVNREMALKAVEDAWALSAKADTEYTKDAITRSTFKMSALMVFKEGKISVIKTIGANSANVTIGLPRGDTTLEVRHPITGQRLCSMNGSDINYARTAAALLVIYYKFAGQKRDHTIALFGAGPVNEKLVELFAEDKDFTGVVRVHSKHGKSNHALVAKFPDVHFTLEAANDNSRLHEAAFINMATSFANSDVFKANEVASNAVILGQGGHEFDYQWLEHVKKVGGAFLVDSMVRGAKRRTEKDLATQKDLAVQSIARWMETKGLKMDKDGEEFGLQLLCNYDFSSRDPSKPVAINIIGDAGADALLAIYMATYVGFYPMDLANDLQ